MEVEGTYEVERTSFMVPRFLYMTRGRTEGKGIDM